MKGQKPVVRESGMTDLNLETDGFAGELVDVGAVWEALRGVNVPGFDIDVISSGLVKKVRISGDRARIAVYVDFVSSDPGCLFCKFINHALMKVVADRIKEALTKLGFQEVHVVDAITNAEI